MEDLRSAGPLYASVTDTVVSHQSSNQKPIRFPFPLKEFQGPNLCAMGGFLSSSQEYLWNGWQNYTIWYLFVLLYILNILLFYFLFRIIFV